MIVKMTTDKKKKKTGSLDSCRYNMDNTGRRQMDKFGKDIWRLYSTLDDIVDCPTLLKLQAQFPLLPSTFTIAWYDHEMNSCF